MFCLFDRCRKESKSLISLLNERPENDLGKILIGDGYLQCSIYSLEINYFHPCIFIVNYDDFFNTKRA